MFGLKFRKNSSIEGNNTVANKRQLTSSLKKKHVKLKLRINDSVDGIPSDAIFEKFGKTNELKVVTKQEEMKVIHSVCLDFLTCPYSTSVLFQHKKKKKRTFLPHTKMMIKEEENSRVFVAKHIKSMEIDYKRLLVDANVLLRKIRLENKNKTTHKNCYLHYPKALNLFHEYGSKVKVNTKNEFIEFSILTRHTFPQLRLIRKYLFKNMFTN